MFSSQFAPKRVSAVKSEPFVDAPAPIWFGKSRTPASSIASVYVEACRNLR